MKTTATLSLLMAGLIAATGALAQSSAPTSNLPTAAGEASTTVTGQPNAATPVAGESRAAVKAEARAANKSGTISHGDIGTTDAKGQQAGLEVKPTDGKTRAELRAEKEMKKAQHQADSNSQLMGARGMGGPNVGAPAGVPANAPAGRLSVQEGGTPN